MKINIDTVGELKLFLKPFMDEADLISPPDGLGITVEYISHRGE